MKVLSITQAELARSHGTGAQVLELLEETDYHHVYWHVCHGMRSESTRSTLLSDRLPPVPGIRKLCRVARSCLGRTWWRGTSVNRAYFESLLRSAGPFDVAYVVVASEFDAARALSLLDIADIPFVLHVCDILEPGGLNQVMTAFASLVSRASCVFSLLPSITAELEKLCSRQFAPLPIGKPASPVTAQPPESGGPVVVTFGGRPYAAGCSALAAAVPLLKNTLGGRLALRYVGPHFRDVPAELKRHCNDLGFVSDEGQFRKHLAEAHIAFLSGPDTLDRFGLYSFPSRVVDYLHAGLPVVGCVPAGSATSRILSESAPDAVSLGESVTSLHDGIMRFGSSIEAWRQANQSAMSAARSLFLLSKVRTTLIDALRNAAERDSHSTGPS